MSMRKSGSTNTRQWTINEPEFTFYRKIGEKYYLSSAKLDPCDAANTLVGENPGGYEPNDLMSKIRTSQADLNCLERSEVAARLDEKEAKDYRDKAKKSVRLCRHTPTFSTCPTYRPWSCGYNGTIP